MRIYSDMHLGEPEPCPYFPRRTARMSMFHAGEVSAGELEALLSEGWRKFGICFFRPSCEGCRECVPVRIPVDTFRPSKSQRRTARKNLDVHMSYGEPELSHDLFAMYREHSAARFGREASLDELVHSLYLPSCPSLQTMYHTGNRLVAAGFLDCSDRALSSVYFIYQPDILHRRPGVLSVMCEIELARQLGLRYYYLGYYVAGNSRMAYKSQFNPHQRYDWERQIWTVSEPASGVH